MNWSATYPQVINIGDTTARMAFKSDTSDTTGFFVIEPLTGTVPTFLQVKNGQNGDGTAVATGFHGFMVGHTVATEYDIDASNLLTGTTYVSYFDLYRPDGTVGVTPVTFSTTGAPHITSTPGTTATEGVLYTYSPTASDTIDHWTLTGNPAGMTLDSSVTGHISWTPSYDRTNSGALELKLYDASSNTAVQDWTVAVTFVAPAFTNSPGTTATENVAYTYTPTYTATDFYKFDLTGAPTGMTVNGTSGVVSWTPTFDQTNSGSLTLTLRSLNGLTDHKDWTVGVAGVAAITSTPRTDATQGVLYTYTPTATGAVTAWAVIGGPTELNFSTTTGAISWIPAPYSAAVPLTIAAYVSGAIAAEQTWTVNVGSNNKTLNIQSLSDRNNSWALASNGMPVGLKQEIGGL
jgi:hypothetical protein